MKILFFRGSLSWDKGNYHQGLICFCHFLLNDTKETIKKASSKIMTRKKIGEDIIILPFCFLDKRENSLQQSEIKFFFEALVEGLEDCIIAPFDNKKELHLHVGSSLNYVQFIEV